MSVHHGERGYEYQKIIATKLILDMFFDVEKSFTSVKYQGARGDNIYVDDIIISLDNGSTHYCQCKQSTLQLKERKKIVLEIVKQYIKDKEEQKYNNKYIIYTECKDEVLRELSEISEDIIKKEINGGIDIESAFEGKWKDFQKLYKHIEVVKVKVTKYRETPIISIEDCKSSIEIEENIIVEEFLKILAKIEIVSVDIKILNKSENTYCQLYRSNIINYQGICSEIIGKLFPIGGWYGVNIIYIDREKLSNFQQ